MAYGSCLFLRGRPDNGGMGTDSRDAVAWHFVARRGDGCGGVSFVGVGTKGSKGYGKNCESGVFDAVFVGVNLGGILKRKDKVAGVHSIGVDYRWNFVTERV